MCAMVATKNKVFVAGAPDLVKPSDSLAAFGGQAGAKLRVVDSTRGETLNEFELPAPPAFDGMIAAYNRRYIVTRDGDLICLTAK